MASASGAGLHELLSSWARTRAEEPALIFLSDGETEAERWSFVDLHRRALGVARAIRQADVCPGPIALLFPPGLDFFSALLGCFYAGAIAVPAQFNPKSRITERLRAILDDANPVLVLTDRRETCERFASPSDTWLATRDLPPANDADAPPGSAPAVLQYTSGSTGEPKGVVIEHAALLHNIAVQHAAFGADAATVLVNWLPMYHDMGLVSVLAALAIGRPSVLLPPLSFLQSPARWLRAISRYGGTISGGPNFGYDLCVSRLSRSSTDTLDLSSWKAAFVGAEPVRAGTLARFAELLSPRGLSETALTPCYGMAEATLLVSAAALADKPKVSTTARVSCGMPIGCEVRIIDPATLQPMAAGSIGEVWIRGPGVARCYWNRPAATQAAFDVALPGQGDGWFRTGDLGQLIDDELYLAGRLKDTLIHRGVNIDPEEVERAAVDSAPRLFSKAAAFAIEVGEEEHVVLALEVGRDALPLGEPEDSVTQVVSAVAAQTGVRLYDLLLVRPGATPRTTSGKTQRGRCRELYLAGQLDRLNATTHKLLSRGASHA